MSEEEELDQEDQRIKVVELGTLEELTEGNSTIARGDWIHTIRPVICNLSKRAEQCWTIVEKVVGERCRVHLLLSPGEKSAKSSKRKKKPTKKNTPEPKRLFIK
jgi:hypothetical protein